VKNGGGAAWAEKVRETARRGDPRNRGLTDDTSRMQLALKWDISSLIYARHPAAEEKVKEKRKFEKKKT